ncbi:glycolipid transfer protein 1-like isoform X3 [Tasmannia lanceolata]|uniref:glycolipid transfer protein 1-like isoform X3 n=1 Tax=Tasmannia lanceolata TaxID=3420 RepID=UPI004064581F
MWGVIFWGVITTSTCWHLIGWRVQKWRWMPDYQFPSSRYNRLSCTAGRLESKYSSNPSEFNLLYNMVRTEIEAKTAKSSSSCTNGLLWLTRAMDFLVELFRNLLAHPDWTMSQVCTDSYNKTLKKWHGWLASSSFAVAMKLAPDRKKFTEVIGGARDLNADMEKFCLTFSPFLEENHKFLASVGLDNLKAS